MKNVPSAMAWRGARGRILKLKNRRDITGQESHQSQEKVSTKKVGQENSGKTPAKSEKISILTY